MTYKPSLEAIAALMEQTGMGELQAIRHLQQREELQRQGRAARPRLGLRFNRESEA